MKITGRKFNIIAKVAFSSVLAGEGFSCAESRHCTFYRKVSEDLYHFILANRLSKVPQYDIRVFFHSPILEPDLWVEKFPDDLGVPTDSGCYLHNTNGVGFDQQLFWCRTEEGFLKDFERRVRPALIMHALPYLNRYSSLETAAPAIIPKSYLDIIERLNFR